MHHKKRRPKAARSGCKICHPSKQTFNVKRDRQRAELLWREYERRAEEGGWPPRGRWRAVSSTW